MPLKFNPLTGKLDLVGTSSEPTAPELPDIGMEQHSAKDGYSDEYITDKDLHNVTLKGNVRPETGAIRVDTTRVPNRFQVYLRDQWNDYYDDMTIEHNDFRHTPLEKQIYIHRGDSVAVGLNGRSVIQEYQTSMGAFPPRLVISGGTF